MLHGIRQASEIQRRRPVPSSLRLSFRFRTVSTASGSKSSYRAYTRNDLAIGDRSPSASRSSAAKSPTRNGPRSRSQEVSRPVMERTDTNASGWATDNEDECRLRRRLGLHDSFWRRADQRLDAIQVLHLSRQRSGRQHLHWSTMRAQPGLHPSYLPHPLHPTQLDSSTDDYDRVADAVPHLGHGDVCLAHRALRRLLRFRAEAHVQHQGLRRLHPGTRRHDGPHGLPVHHGLLRVHVLPELHRGLQGFRGIGHRDGDHRADAGGTDGGGQGACQASVQPGPSRNQGAGISRGEHARSCARVMGAGRGDV
nr:hypothetical protein CFP56_63341 [Quercus suber]